MLPLSPATKFNIIAIKGTNVMKIVTAILVICALHSTNVLAGPEDSYDRTTDVKKVVWMDLGKAAAKAKLKDPSSAQFRNVYFHKGADGIPMTCGEVNPKNSYGGYSGYQKFVSAGESELTFLQAQVVDFGTAWNQFCR